MKAIKILLFLLIPLVGFTQSKTIAVKYQEDKKEQEGTTDNNIYNTAGLEKKPEYPGGMMEFYKYIGKKYRTPDVKGLQGKVLVSFVIEKDGSITNIKVIKDIGFGTGEDAIRVLQNCERWIPGEQNGKKVRTLFTLPITIKAS